VQVGRGGVKAGLDAQRAASLAALFQALAQVAYADDFSRTLLKKIKLFVYRWKRAHAVFQYTVASIRSGGRPELPMAADSDSSVLPCVRSTFKRIMDCLVAGSPGSSVSRPAAASEGRK